MSVRCHGMTGWPAHWAQTATEREARAHTGHTMALHTAASRTCAGPRRASFSLPRQTRMRSALSFQLPSGAKEEVCLRTCLGLGSAWRECGAASRCVRGLPLPRVHSEPYLQPQRIVLQGAVPGLQSLTASPLPCFSVGVGATGFLGERPYPCSSAQSQSFPYLTPAFRAGPPSSLPTAAASEPCRPSLPKSGAILTHFRRKAPPLPCSAPFSLPSPWRIEQAPTAALFSRPLVLPLQEVASSHSAGRRRHGSLRCGSRDPRALASRVLGLPYWL